MLSLLLLLQLLLLLRHSASNAGVDLRDTEAVEESEKTGTHELCAVVYDVNVLGRVPNFMKVLLTIHRTFSKPFNAYSSVTLLLIFGHNSSNNGLLLLQVLLRRPQRGADSAGGRAGIGPRGGASREGIIKRWESLQKKHNRELSIGSPMRSLKMMWSQVRALYSTIVFSTSVFCVTTGGSSSRSSHLQCLIVCSKYTCVDLNVCKRAQRLEASCILLQL
jgi:hypothetical protein